MEKYLEDLHKEAVEIADKRWTAMLGNRASKAGMGSVAAAIYSAWHENNLTEVTPDVREVTADLAGDVIIRSFNAWQAAMEKRQLLTDKVDSGVYINVGDMAGGLISLHLANLIREHLEEKKREEYLG